MNVRLSSCLRQVLAGMTEQRVTVLPPTLISVFVAGTLLLLSGFCVAPCLAHLPYPISMRAGLFCREQGLHLQRTSSRAQRWRPMSRPTLLPARRSGGCARTCRCWGVASSRHSSSGEHGDTRGRLSWLEVLEALWPAGHMLHSTPFNIAPLSWDMQPDCSDQRKCSDQRSST